MRGFITRRDFRVMQRANHWLPPRWIQMWAVLATRLGDGWVWGATGLCVLVFGDSERFYALGAGALAALSSIVAFMFLKRITGRTRPCEIEPHCWATLLPPDQFSFPSGHTMTAFAMTIAFSMFYPSTSPCLLFCAFSIAVSRILLGMHFLSDVVAGAVLGVGLGYGSYLVFTYA